jgi:hypothetical protein
MVAKDVIGVVFDAYSARGVDANGGSLDCEGM